MKLRVVRTRNNQYVIEKRWLLLWFIPLWFTLSNEEVTRFDIHESAVIFLTYKNAYEACDRILEEHKKFKESNKITLIN